MNLVLLPIIILFSFPLILVYGESVDDLPFMIYKGTQYNRLGDYEKGISIFEEVLKNDKKNVEALINLGNSYSSLNNHFTAIKYYERVLDIDPDNSLALYRMQQSLLEQTSYKFGFLYGILEIRVYDSQGWLIAYLQSKQIKTLNHQISEKFVDSWEISKNIVHRNNQDYSIHQNEFVEVMNKNTILGFHEIPFSEKMDLPFASTWHYQIPVEKGDVVSYAYSFYRPIN